MELSIVILHHGGPHEVTQNLLALSRAVLPLQTEVLVINNGFTGANARIQVPKSHRYGLRFFEIENKGYPNGNNFALHLAKGKFLCILNPDIVVGRDTFKVLLNYLKNHSSVGLVGPRLRYPDGTIQDNYRTFPRIFDLIVKRTLLRKFFKNRMRRYLMWDKDASFSEPVDWLTGAFQVFTRRAWDKVGPNEERYFLFMSDVDLCRLMWRKGLEVHFVGETEALHNDGRLSAGGVLDLFRKPILRIHVKDAVKYYWKWCFRRLPKRAPSGRW